MRTNIERSCKPVQPAGVSTDMIEQRLGKLIRHYVQTRSPAIASSVVRHIEMLCTHPGFEGGSSELCSYLRLKTHWRWLAMDSATGSNKTATHKAQQPNGVAAVQG